MKRYHIRVYVAGAYSGYTTELLDNIRKGIRLSTEVLLAGFSPFSPWNDYIFQLMLREGEELTVDDYYDYSLSWLSASHVMLLVPGWENSKGTQKEIEFAEKWSIPIFETLNELKEWAAGGPLSPIKVNL